MVSSSWQYWTLRLYLLLFKTMETFGFECDNLKLHMILKVLI